MPGNVTTAPALLDGVEGGRVIADRGYDTNEVRTACNRIERFKHVRRMATRCDRCDIHFLSFIHLTSALL